MNPDNIMQSDVLDILFENRNKFYGAYELRKNYNVRLKKAIAFTATVAALFIGLQYLHLKRNEATDSFPNILNTVKLTQVNIPEPNTKPQKTPPIKQKPIATDTYKNVTIVKDDKVKDTVHTIADVLEKVIGTEDIKGENIGNKILPITNAITTTTADVATKAEPENDRPLPFAQIMPQFPGGTDALIRFLQQNLKQPDDLQESEKLVVIANFVIDITGNVQNIKIEQSARADLDADVIRVLKRMPQWSVGMQNGRKVSVIYRLPVTFIAHD